MLYKFIEEYFWMNILTDFLTDFLRFPLMDFLTDFLTGFFDGFFWRGQSFRRSFGRSFGRSFQQMFWQFFYISTIVSFRIEVSLIMLSSSNGILFQNRFLWEKVALLVEKNFPHTFYQNTSFNHFILKKTFLESYFPNIGWKKSLIIFGQNLEIPVTV